MTAGVSLAGLSSLSASHWSGHHSVCQAGKIKDYCCDKIIFSELFTGATYLVLVINNIAIFKTFTKVQSCHESFL